jgi:phytoene synthase
LHEAERARTIIASLREGDPDRYLATLFAPASARNELFALYALNVELARIGERVSEPDLAAIKLQWWRDAIKRTASGEATASPVADAIGALLQAHPRAAEPIGRLIDAREFDVAVKIMPDMPALEDYLDATAGSLFAAAGGILGLRHDACASIARIAGLAYGLTGLMRAMPVHALNGRVDLPEDALLSHGITPANILQGQASEGLQVLLAENRERALVALVEARRHAAELTPHQQTAFLPLSLVQPYLASLAKVAHDPFKNIAAINPLYRLWRLASWQMRSGLAGR